MSKREHLTIEIRLIAEPTAISLRRLCRVYDLLLGKNLKIKGVRDGEEEMKATPRHLGGGRSNLRA